MITQLLHTSSYMTNLIVVLAGCVVLGFDIALGVIANVILNAPEVFVKAVSLMVKKEVCDIDSDILSALLSVVFFNGKLISIREETVISTIFVGFFVNIFCNLLRKPLTRLLEKIWYKPVKLHIEIGDLNEF